MSSVCPPGFTATRALDPSCDEFVPESNKPPPTAIRALDPSRDEFVPESNKPPPTPIRALDDIGPGCILWLPEGYQPPPGYKLRDPDEGASDHPIVVLSIAGTDPEVAIISFLLMRSFRSKDGPDTSAPNFWDHYVKLSRSTPPSKNTPVSLPTLMLEFRPEGCQLARTSYIDVRTVYSARCRDLRLYDDRSQETSGSLLRINMKSFKYVWERMEGCVGMGAEWTWVRTDQLKEDYAMRVKKLEATATTTTSLYSAIYSLLALLLDLLPTIVAIVFGMFHQPRRSAGSTRSGGDTTPIIATWPDGVLGFGVLLRQALPRVATPEAGTAREGIHAADARMLTCMIYATMPLLLRLPPSQGARGRSSSDVVSVAAGVMSMVALCAVCFKTLAATQQQRAETGGGKQ